jgi:insulysin
LKIKNKFNPLKKIYIFYYLIFNCFYPKLCHAHSKYLEESITQLPPPCQIQNTVWEKLILKNGLKVFLISKPDLHYSAASLCIAKGSNEDPPTLPGLTHLLEHSLFLGSKKYPSKPTFETFVYENGGNFDAETFEEIMEFNFTIKNDAFEEALDCFSNFFKEPLFDDAQINNEIKIIDQEFNIYAQDDDFKKITVLKHLANPKSPSAHFGCGNSKTLKKISSKDLKIHFEKFISSNLMFLTLISSKPLKNMKALVTSLFQHIPERNLVPVKTKEPFLNNSSLCKFVSVASKDDIKELSIIWSLPIELYLEDKIFTTILNSKSKDSLFEILASEQLITNINLSKSNYINDFIYSVNFSLTNDGLEKKHEIIEIFYSYLAFLINCPPSRQYLQDLESFIKKTSLNSYPPFLKEEAAFFSRAMIHENFETFPAKSLCYQNTDQPFKITNICRYSPPLVVLACKEACVNVNETIFEPQFQTPYVVYPIEKPILEQLQNSAKTTKYQFKYPKIELKSNTNSNQTLRYLSESKQIYKDHKSLIFHTNDTLFSNEGFVADICFVHPVFNSQNIQNFVKLCLLTRYLNQKIRNSISDATFEFIPSKIGLRIHIKSSYDIKEYLDIFKKALNDIEISAYLKTEELLDLKKNLNPLPNAPFEKLNYLYQNLRNQNLHSIGCRIKALEKLNEHELESKLCNKFNHSFIFASFYGNINEDNCINNIKTLCELIENPIFFDELSLIQSKNISIPYLEFNINSNDPQNAFFLIMENNISSIKDIFFSKILSIGLKEAFKNYLRTKTQVSYLNDVWNGTCNGKIQQFIYAQSTNKSAQELRIIFNEAFEDFENHFGDLYLSKKTFETIKDSLLKTPLFLFNDPQDVNDFLFMGLFENEIACKEPLKQQEVLKNIQYDDFKKFCLHFLKESKQNSTKLYYNGFSSSNISDEEINENLRLVDTLSNQIDF